MESLEKLFDWLDVDYLLNLRWESNPKFTLNEERGIPNNLVPLVDELYNELNNIGPIIENIDGVVYYLSNYKIRTDSFIEEIKLVVNLIKGGSNGDKGMFDIDLKSDNCISDNGKLKNIIIRLIIDIDNADKNISIPKLNFEQLLYHELTHAYRFYQIQKSQEQDRIDRENKRKEDYAVAFNSQNINGLMKLFWNAYYLSEDDEINSKVTEIYSYIKNNKDINRKTIYSDIEEYLKIPSVMEMKSLERLILVLNRQDDFTKNFLGEAYKNVKKYDKALDGFKCFKLFLDRLNLAVTKYQKQAQKVIEYSLQKLERLGEK